MTTNEPDVVAWYTPATRYTLPVVALDDRSQRGEPLIRLSDYQRLQAECENLRKAIRRLCNIYVVDDYYSGDIREEQLSRSVERAIDAAEQGDP